MRSVVVIFMDKGLDGMVEGLDAIVFEVCFGTSLKVRFDRRHYHFSEVAWEEGRREG